MAKQAWHETHDAPHCPTCECGDATGWINVKEQMPQERVRVLCNAGGVVRVLALMPSWKMNQAHPAYWQGEAVNSTWQIIPLEKISHWMRLPALPNKQLPNPCKVKE